MASRRLALLVTFGIPLALACGARSGLIAPAIEEETDSGVDASKDSGRDVHVNDARPDVLPPIDATKPPDADKTDCPDADQTYIYVIADDNSLARFDPISGNFKTIGLIACGDTESPFSMAVDRKGAAYILFRSGKLYRVSTATAACAVTPFDARVGDFSVFGMGFSSDVGGAKETLYIAANAEANQTEGLGLIDLTTFKSKRISVFDQELGGAELTGTGDGRLFAFYKDPFVVTASHIGQIDKVTGQRIADDSLPNVDQGRGWAFAFWGGDFYMFTAPDFAGSRVTRFRSSDKSVVEVGKFASRIVGAGVSTCAPE